MRSRFLIAVSEDAAALQAIEIRCRSLIRDAEARMFVAGPQSVFVIAERAAIQPLNAQGVLIGSLFKRGCSGSARLEPTEQMAVRQSRGTALTDTFWGGYVAVLADHVRATIDIVRAPLGDLPCYWTRTPASVLVASDLPLLDAGGMGKPSIDASALARQLAAENIRRSETCLNGILEMPGGTRLTLDAVGAATSQALWSPSGFTDANRQIVDRAEAQRRVRDAVLHAVQAQTARFERVLLKLSGGLDSSIVAASLHAARQPFTALNLVTRDAAGDERCYAKTVASHLNAPLVTRLRRATRVRIERSAAAKLPRPTARSFVQESSRLALETAARSGCEAMVDGGGGDNVFCSLQSARPAADCLLGEAGIEAFYRTSRSIAELAQESVANVLWRAFLISRRRSHPYPWQLDLRFLSADACAESRSAVDHPWLTKGDGGLPGKAAHIALVVAAQSVAEGFDVEDPLPTYSPLITQPVVEACLRVPSWMWFDGGCNRSVARSAFEGLLPRSIVARRSKAAPDCFVAELYEANSSKIRTMLMEGVLRRLRLLDPAPLDRLLRVEAPVEGHDYLRVMQLVDAEAWARCWC
jgi:asparagine synthase (glutamine-hydrolysing)